MSIFAACKTTQRTYKIVCRISAGKFERQEKVTPNTENTAAVFSVFCEGTIKMALV